MDPISAGLAGIALVQKSVEFIKSNINTVNDIRDIVGAIDSLFEGEKDINKERFGDKSLLGQTKDAASSVIDAKLAREAMDEMHALVDNRFGFGTWAEIVAERNRRIKEEKEAIAAEKKKAAQRKAQMKHNMMVFLTASGGGLVLMIAIGFAVIYLTGGL
jgi:hypothetical protein